MPVRTAAPHNTADDYYLVMNTDNKAVCYPNNTLACKVMIANTDSAT